MEGTRGSRNGWTSCATRSMKWPPRRRSGAGARWVILPESAATATSGPARDRAVPLKGEVRDTFGTPAHRHSYIRLPLDLAEEGPHGPIASNTAVFFDRRGEVAGSRRKLHPEAGGGDDLEAGITPGRYVPVFGRAQRRLHATAGAVEPLRD